MGELRDGERLTESRLESIARGRLEIPNASVLSKHKLPLDDIRRKAERHRARTRQN